MSPDATTSTNERRLRIAFFVRVVSSSISQEMRAVSMAIWSGVTDDWMSARMLVPSRYIGPRPTGSFSRRATASNSVRRSVVNPWWIRKARPS